MPKGPATTRPAACDLTRRRILKALAAAAAASTVLASAAAAADGASFSITIDENAEARYGPATIYVDGEKRGIAEAGCCMMFSTTFGEHQLKVAWADRAVGAVFEVKPGAIVSFHVSADRQLSRTD